LLAVGRALINPAMHQRVELAAFTDEIIVRLTHVAELHRIGELAVKIELRRDPARKNPISPMVDEHLAPPLKNAA
jgi:hypothetical protein